VIYIMMLPASTQMFSRLIIAERKVVAKTAAHPAAPAGDAGELASAV
jgi:hypothetical protein